MKASQGSSETSTQAAHTTPVVTLPGVLGQPGVSANPLDGGWALSYWANRTATTSTWALPATLTPRGDVIAPAVSARVTIVAGDGGTALRSGSTVGGQVATATAADGTASITSQATMWTVALQRG